MSFCLCAENYVIEDEMLMTTWKNIPFPEAASFPWREVAQIAIKQPGLAAHVEHVTPVM